MDLWNSGFTIKLLCQVVFIFVLTALFLNWLASRWIKWKNSGQKSKTEDPNVLKQYKDQHNSNVKQIQDDYNEKSQEYKEKVLIPREEAQRRKKEAEYSKILGETWKGQGHSLGGDIQEDEATSGLPEGRRAANQRKTLEDINQELAASVAAEAIATATKKAKLRVIELPAEPDEDDQEAVTVKFRTPLGTTCSRRFNKQDNVQCLLDYITTKGFSQKVYNISTSYPRRTLVDQETSLSELGFGQKVALNIEEKE